MAYINNDVKIIPQIRINVPKIDRDIFIEGIINYLKCLKAEDDYHYSFAEMTDALTFDGEVNLSYELNEFITDSIILDCENAFVTAAEYNNPNFNSILGVHQLSNEFVFWGILTGGDWEIPAIRIIYFDGKNFQSYVPSYGNTINLNIDGAFGNDEDEDEDYLKQFNLNVSDLNKIDLNNLIDPSMILQVLETVFTLQGNYNGTIRQQPSSNSNNPTSTSTSSQKNTSTMDVLLQVFESKNFTLIPPLQTSLLNKGYKIYDKSLCWNNLSDKDTMLKDIYNYILQFDNNGSYYYKFVECNKIVTYIKKYKYRFEGYLYN